MIADLFVYLLFIQRCCCAGASRVAAAGRGAGASRAGAAGLEAPPRASQRE